MTDARLNAVPLQCYLGTCSRLKGRVSDDEYDTIFRSISSQERALISSEKKAACSISNPGADFPLAPNK